MTAIGASRARVRSSSAPIRRLYPPISAARTAASRRSTRSPPTKPLQPVHQSMPRCCRNEVKCPIWVIRVTLAVRRSLPVYRQLRTCRCTAITDAMCQHATSTDTETAKDQNRPPEGGRSAQFTAKQ